MKIENPSISALLHDTYGDQLVSAADVNNTLPTKDTGGVNSGVEYEVATVTIALTRDSVIEACGVCVSWTNAASRLLRLYIDGAKVTEVAWSNVAALKGYKGCPSGNRIVKLMFIQSDGGARSFQYDGYVFGGTLKT